MTLKAEQIIIGLNRNCSYLLHTEAGSDVIIIDPNKFDPIEEALNKLGKNPVAIWLTHSHPDHTAAIPEFSAKYNIPVYCYPLAAERISDLAKAGLKTVKEGDLLNIEKLSAEILFTPGHRDDSICFYFKNQGILFTGDTLFCEGCGRTDLEGSDINLMYESLQRLKQLPSKTQIYPGHHYGSQPVSTIEHELANNKYLFAKDFAEFKSRRA